MTELNAPPPSPTGADVDRIAAVADPVLRNLLITQCYHELAAALAARTGPYANWCTFATWASKQAGQTIRGEDLGRQFKHRLTTAPPARQAAAAVAAAAQRPALSGEAETLDVLAGQALNPAAALERAGAAVARGNLKVFAEIGREFARFGAACLSDAAYDAGRLADFCAGLRPGDPPDGQRYLRQAFTRYYQALFESEPKARGELMLLANLEIGLHEQTRLQPEIAAALEAAVVEPGPLTRDLLGLAFPLRGWPAYAFLLVMRLLRRPTPLDSAMGQLVAVARQQLRLFLTEHLMALGFPRGIQLPLGADLRAAFPPVLQHLTHPELGALLERIDPTPDSLRATGAVDWADLAERLHFIADLFRCYAVTPELADPPFTPAQTADLQAGRRPSGPL